MEYFLWTIIGLFAGIIASIITNTRESLFLNILTGILGAFVGGIFIALYGYAGINGINVYSILVAAFGATIVLLVGRRFA
jgi:uncharacterized membrane protein YeaQ/YmgE (transglycosylase-associated protein family)